MYNNGDVPYIPPNVTPRVGLVTSIASAGVGAMVIPPGAYGGYIVNPYSISDQGISVTEPLFVNPISSPPLQGFGGTFALYPGQPWVLPIVKSTTGVWVNATTAGHQFTCVYWMGP